MMLSDPQARRGFRAVIEGLVPLVLLGLIARVCEDARADSELLHNVVRGALMIIALGTIGYVLENVTRAFKLKLDPEGVVIDAAADDAPVDNGADK